MMMRFAVILELAVISGCSVDSRVPEKMTGEMPTPRALHPAPKPGEVLQMSVKELGNFEYNQQKGGNIPPDVKRLSGSTIRLTGYMVPSGDEEATEFALVPSLNDASGEGGNTPKIQQTVMVECPAGKSVSYDADPIVVQGKLIIEEKRDDGYIVSIFEVQASSVMPASK